MLSQIGPHGIRLCCKAARALLVVRLRLNRMQFKNLLASLDRIPEDRRPFCRQNLAHAEVYRKTLNFLLITCLKLKKPCLLRSLTLFTLLRQEGTPVQIHFGIDHELSASTGHAWLSLNGRPFMENADPRNLYLETLVYPDDSIS